MKHLIKHHLVENMPNFMLSNWEKIVTLLNKAGQEVMSYQAGYFSDILVKVFLDEDLRIFEEKEFDFGCGCSIDKFKQTMSIYSMKEIEHMTNDLGKVIADCQFCGAQYIFSPSELVRKTGSSIHRIPISSRA